MGAFGDNLRREREMRGITLKEIAETTKIGARMLDAIETERFERLPGGVFNRAFVRQYARYLGLGEEHVVADFDATFAVFSEAAEKSRQNQMLPPAWVQRRALEKQEEAERDRSRWPLRIAVTLMVLGALGIGGWRWLGVRTAQPAHNAGNEVAPPAPLKSTPPPPKAEATPATAAADTPADSALPSGPLILELEAVERVQFAVSQDGKPVWRSVLRAGSRRTVRAATSLELDAGNAGALLITLNGESRGALGEKNEQKTVTYTLKDLKPQPRSGGVRP
jgi:cytoskeletal protein RodZ